MRFAAVSRDTAKLIVLVGMCCAAIVHPARAQDALGKIKTIVVIYAENRSFDHLYGLFPGANGISNATTEQKTQLDHDGSALPYLTYLEMTESLMRDFRDAERAIPDRCAADQDLARTDIGPARSTPSTTHQEQINGGKQQHVRGNVECRRLYHGAFRR